MKVYELLERATPVTESLSPEQRERLDDLISQYRNATDPSAEYDDYNDYATDSDEDIINQIRVEFGDRVADQVSSGALKMHYPRDNHTAGYDPLSWKEPVNRITKAGKLYKQDSDFRKNTIASRFRNAGKSSI